jgi:hypothetical protein
VTERSGIPTATLGEAVLQDVAEIQPRGYLLRKLSVLVADWSSDLQAAQPYSMLAHTIENHRGLERTCMSYKSNNVLSSLDSLLADTRTARTSSQLSLVCRESWKS